MTRLELILTSLSEGATRIITVETDAQGFNENNEAAVKGGAAGGRARRNLEKDIQKAVVSAENFLGLKGNDDKGALKQDDEIIKQ